MKSSVYTHLECEKIAKKASLIYISDGTSGITRKRVGKGFVYLDPNGVKITDPQEIKRINSLAVPPAYHDVWISPVANGHIQACGRDDKNRKQYRYHPSWEKVRRQQKFRQMIPFGKMLPMIRQRVEEELNRPVTLQKSQMICVVLYLLDRSSIRIGNPVYAKENKTYGVTTLRKKHISIQSNRAALTFEGKNAKIWHVNLLDKRIVRILKKCVQLSGYELFKFLENDQKRTLTAQDVTHFLRELTDYPFTAKDFRTWSACRETLIRLVTLAVLEEEPTQAHLTKVIAQVAKLHGHTAKVCQKSYIYPEILESWLNGNMHVWVNQEKNKIEKLSNKDELLLHWLATFSC
jgi:DNA topoisomerase-1